MLASWKGVQVPFTRREWDIVTSLYRSNEAAKLKQAVELIISWKARSGHSVHMAADMTEMLLRAIIMDKQSKDEEWFKKGNVQLAYCAAIIRFVNYVNEICQSSDRFQSIASAVSDVGIPQWVVDIRHQATHAHLPTLQHLREAAQYCRDWLWEHHWSRPVAETFNMDLNLLEDNDEIALQQKAARLIDRFMFCALKKKGGKQDMNSKLQDVLTEMETFVMTYPREFLGAFLLEGYLIMDEKQAKSIGSNLFADDEDIWIIPEDLQLFWKPVLHYLNEAKMLPELLFQSICLATWYCFNRLCERPSVLCHVVFRSIAISRITTIFQLFFQLFEVLSGAEMHSAQERQLVAWIDKMLKAYIESSVLTLAEWERVLKAMLSIRGKLKEIHFSRVITKLEKITGEKWAAVRELAVLSIEKPTTAGDLSSLNSNNGTSIRTVEDLQKLISRIGGEKQPRMDDAANVGGTGRWRSCDSAEWKGIPLGLTPEQSTESLYLVVEPETVRIRKKHLESPESIPEL